MKIIIFIKIKNLFNSFSKLHSNNMYIIYKFNFSNNLFNVGFCTKHFVLLFYTVYTKPGSK